MATRATAAGTANCGDFGDGMAIVVVNRLLDLIRGHLEAVAEIDRWRENRWGFGCEGGWGHGSGGVLGKLASRQMRPGGL